MTSSRRKPHQTDAYLSLPESTRRRHNAAVRFCIANDCNALTPQQTHSLGVSVPALGQLLHAGLWQVVELPAIDRDEHGRIRFAHHIIDPRLGANHD